LDIKTLYNNHADLVFTLAFKYLQNREESEEVSQDVFMKVYEKLDSFKNESDIKTWIYRITINASLDAIKAKNRDKRSMYKNSLNTEDVIISNSENPNTILESTEKQAILLKCIDKLSENQKTAFLLSKEEGLSNTEIASIMNTSISGVESLIFRAKSNLKNIVSEMWPEYRKKRKHYSTKFIEWKVRNGQMIF
jgi:RNA polymerase sigma-70 factor (ECF subfamily)